MRIRTGREDSMDGGRTEYGIADADAMHSENFNMLTGRDGGIDHDGSGLRIAKKLLKAHARRKQSAGRKGEVIFQREGCVSKPTPGWSDQGVGNLSAWGVRSSYSGNLDVQNAEMTEIDVPAGCDSRRLLSRGPTNTRRTAMDRNTQSQAAVSPTLADFASARGKIFPLVNRVPCG